MDHLSEEEIIVDSPSSSGTESSNGLLRYQSCHHEAEADDTMQLNSSTDPLCNFEEQEKVPSTADIRHSLIGLWKKLYANIARRLTIPTLSRGLKHIPSVITCSSIPPILDHLHSMAISIAITFWNTSPSRKPTNGRSKAVMAQGYTLNEIRKALVEGGALASLPPHHSEALSTNSANPSNRPLIPPFSPAANSLQQDLHHTRPPSSMEVKRVDGRFRLKENLGTCTKCSMFQAANLVDLNHTVLVKIGQSKHHSLLEREQAILDQLRGLPGIPGIIWSGTEFEQDVMIFEDLGPTLDDVFKSTGYIYSNIRPQNILVGPVLPGQQTNQLCLFDFSLTQLYRDPRTYSHVPFVSGHPLSTILPFASLNHHSGNQLSHRDGLESLTYLLLYLACSSLPWIDTNVTSNSDVLQSKESISVAQLCDALPLPFATFLSYACDLSFTQKPDYNYVLNLFRALHTDTTAPLPALSPAIEMSEQAYWMEDVVSLHPKLAVSVYEMPRKRRRDTTVAPPTSVKSWLSASQAEATLLLGGVMRGQDYDEWVAMSIDIHDAYGINTRDRGSTHTHHASWAISSLALA
ncbi:hypothetical protein PAXINDRAFT_11296 [Paxillus involutus ATCC 200175]|uniref:Protein kinase domain-containing protein n=1 Tax=Paxillus involutus ATCC 200175 TaxID=664439 RepID=A0A0C9U9S8_PAXIN|nr:hypothetical protein PAXINDRAFT_11296 [Paxillus involutus ATCC 200175]